jgi:ABC-type multidrug transport system permease subunit
MNFRRLWAIFIARNHEFFRDRSAFGWNFIFPFLLVGGFALIFGGEGRKEYKVGVFPLAQEQLAVPTSGVPPRFLETKFVEFIAFEDRETAFNKLLHHKIDFLLKAGSKPYEYWVSTTSPRGYFVERIFKSSLMSETDDTLSDRKEVKGREIRYIDWFFPGILAMNMMFSALWGVGYIVVRYRKNGVLKRLKATPLTSLEYLAAQTLSRIFLLMFTLVVVWIGCDLVFSFHVEGSYLHLFIVFFMGGVSLTALGLLIASRGTSEEFTSGILNFITWPMMFLSEVWFSLEGSPQWIKLVAKIFPLTHMLTAARKVMNDGANLFDIGPELLVLAGMIILFLSMGAFLFSWRK